MKYNNSMPARFSTRSNAGESALNALAEARALRLRKGLPVRDLSLSNPTMAGLARQDSLFDLVHQANREYHPDPRGLRSSREALTAHMAGLGRDLHPDRLFFCASTSEAYSWLFKLLCDPQDAVLIPRPGYPLFEHLARLELVEPVPYRLEYAHPSGWHVDVDSIRSFLSSPAGHRAKALIVINPNNPTGSYLRPRERKEILELCARYSLALIADEVFFDFPILDDSSVHTEAGVLRHSFAGETGVLTFVLDGLSKRLGMPQMKLGWIAVSGPAEETSRACQRLELIADTFLSAGTPVMNALPCLLSAEAEFLSAMKIRIRSNHAQYRQILESEHSPHRVMTTQGGWTALVESPSLMSEEELALRLLETRGISVQPGYFFDIERGVHFAFSLILPLEEAGSMAKEYFDFFVSL